MAYDDIFAANENVSYSINVDLYNHQSSKGPGTGHLGIAFNMLDTDNYEGFYIRYRLFGNVGIC